MELDLLIRDARVVDGTGSPWRRADLGVSGDRIAFVGRADRLSAAREVDAEDRVLTPGFVDIHTHSDLGLLNDPPAQCIVRQGVTTEVIGNCGVSAAPVAEETRELAARQLDDYGFPVDLTWDTYAGYLATLEARGVGVNVAPLVGHSTVRLAVLGFEDRRPEADELALMRGHVDEAMRAGCFGLSSGLVYPPGCFGDTEEVVALAGVAAAHGGLYASHIRGERETIVEAVRECIAIGERSGCRTQISHNCPKFGGWHLQDEVIALWEDARARGLDVTVDNDLHTDFAPTLREALPQWVQEVPVDEFVAHLADAEFREGLRRQVERDRHPAFGPAGLLKHGAWERIVVLRSPSRPEQAGRTIAELAAERGTDPWTTYFDLIVEERNEAEGLFDYIDGAAIERMLRHPLVMVCSDGWVIPPAAMTSEDPPAPYMPCAYGEYPGLFERYVVNEPVLTLEEAVRKSTSMPATKIGLPDRGLIAPGMKADLVLMDLPNVRDNATNLWPHTPPIEEYPHAYPDGIDVVIVNGEVAVDEGAFLGLTAGRVLRATGAPA
jgi:N-acyl-D-amino-acid deacylase